MKKLLFATAIAASAAAFATDPFNAISFESYTPGATFANGATENNDFGTGPFFYFDGASNSSVVTNETPVPGTATRPKYFVDNSGTGNSQYLALDTEGGIFWRSLSTISHEQAASEEEEDTYGLGAAQAVNDGIYLDTMVQFTVTEDDPPAVTANDKLAIWLQAGEGTTNLMVKASTCTFEGALDFQPTTFAIPTTCVNVEAGNWYRLTVKAIKNIVASPTTVVPAFEIRIDGTQLVASTAQIGADFQSMLSANNAYAAGMEALASANKLFPYLLPEAYADESDVALQGVGFQGTGAIDDLVLTTDDPFAGVAPTTVDFTLSGGANATVAYVYGETSGTWDGTATAIAIPQGTNVTFTATPNANFTYAGVDLTGTPWTLSGTSITATYSDVAAATTVAVPAAVAAPTYPDYIVDTTDAYITGKYNTWKNAYKADTASAWETAFLLNMDPDATVAEGTALLKIASITEVENGWQLEITSEATTLAAENGTTKVGNGYLRIKTASSLTVLDTDSATVTYIPVAVTDGKILVTVSTAAGQFMKAELTTTAPAGE